MHLDLHPPLENVTAPSWHLNNHQIGAIFIGVGIVAICRGQMTTYTRWEITRWLSLDSEEREVSGFARFVITAIMIGSGIYLLRQAS